MSGVEHMELLELIEKMEEVRGEIYADEWAKVAVEYNLDPMKVIIIRYQFYCGQKKE